ncbi:hypothetical protein DYU05_00560 [Mucilaginibacter terrenus]|uniref:Uncharacterized protein n=1 Tax=Mucilaginibacter terrenus TaxID=2482727 RepID=A0A3E2NTB1_9SPHI|nr:hypothetical protein DYU05_00560 [Mucilaginibacter terrenus]
MKGAISVINQADLNETSIDKKESGAILIIGSCITNGKNLLYLSRFFRNYEEIRLVYFVGINRVSDIFKNKELKTNIKYGLYGPENSSFVEIETISCDNANLETPWKVELQFLKRTQAGLDEPSEFIESRIETIKSFSNINYKGGSDKIFYPSLSNSELEIRKNSAFFKDNSYYGNICQSDVYFTIACVLNNMRNNSKDGLCQTTFVKNLLDPFVFSRFNDGIIQASILRAAKNEELNYSISQSHSFEILSLIGTFIKHINEYQGEATIEFLHALAIGKLRLNKSHYLLLKDQLEKIGDERLSFTRRRLT